MKSFTFYRHTEEPDKGWLTLTKERESDVPHVVEYDDTAPCWFCGLPVGELSMGGPNVCPACDCGVHRDGREWSMADTNLAYDRYRENRRRAESGESALTEPLFNAAGGPRC